jgi:hypothetical protein
MPRLPKYNGSRLFHKINREVKNDFIKRNGRKPTIPEFNEIQKWTSKNIYSDYKGTSYKKLDLKKVQKDITLKTTPKELQICGNVFNVNPIDYTLVEWWNIDNIIQGLPKDVKIRINGGSFYGVSKLEQAYTFNYYDDIQEIFEKIRIEAGNKSDGSIFFEGLIKVVPKAKNNGEPCNYFIDFVLNDKTGSVDNEEGFDTLSQPTPEDKERFQRLTDVQKKKKITKQEQVKKSKGRKRPTATKAEAEAKKKAEKSKSEDVNAILKSLKEDYKDGIFSKKEYRAMVKKVIDNLKKGGVV